MIDVRNSGADRSCQSRFQVGQLDQAACAVKKIAKPYPTAAAGNPRPGILVVNGVSWEAVRELFQAQVAVERLHPGAALSVYHRGRLALDLVAGLADTQRGVLVRTDTLFPLRSAGKPFASVALLQLTDRGRLELEAPVAT